MGPLNKGRYAARIASGSADIQAAQALRYKAFLGACPDAPLDADAFDDLCTHFLIEDTQTGAL